MRVVLDTNIFISGILGGKLSIIIDQWRMGKFTLIVSDSIIDEYREVINRPKFKLNEKNIMAMMDYLLKYGEFVKPLESIAIIEADPSDNKFLEAAVAGYALYIVSGDNHLLDLNIFRHIPILSAREFIEKLNQ